MVVPEIRHSIKHRRSETVYKWKLVALDLMEMFEQEAVMCIEITKVMKHILNESV
jgi:hypothetical protein